jgi:hypothetical protein
MEINDLQKKGMRLKEEVRKRSLRQNAVIYSKINPELSEIIMEINDLRRSTGFNQWPLTPIYVKEQAPERPTLPY